MDYVGLLLGGVLVISVGVFILFVALSCNKLTLASISTGVLSVVLILAGVFMVIQSTAITCKDKAYVYGKEYHWSLSTGCIIK